MALSTPDTSFVADDDLGNSDDTWLYSPKQVGIKAVGQEVPSRLRLAEPQAGIRPLAALTLSGDSMIQRFLKTRDQCTAADWDAMEASRQDFAVVSSTAPPPLAPETDDEDLALYQLPVWTHETPSIPVRDAIRVSDQMYSDYLAQWQSASAPAQPPGPAGKSLRDRLRMKPSDVARWSASQTTEPRPASRGSRPTTPLNTRSRSVTPQPSPQARGSPRTPRSNSPRCPPRGASPAPASPVARPRAHTRDSPRMRPLAVSTTRPLPSRSFTPTPPRLTPPISPLRTESDTNQVRRLRSASISSKASSLCSTDTTASSSSLRSIASSMDAMSLYATTSTASTRARRASARRVFSPSSSPAPHTQRPPSASSSSPSLIPRRAPHSRVGL
ncbi:hypothetical protein H4R34_000331 [Dimargaris verticillata]|uniref:Uncharacterized protein n=1 Tax=Dimargaris verticillata TaxID=2761393 RepID=A0A9W8BAN1_9FUNG|nr:hypothetical protein H4R34_000331 [Dimargaris verticillata]